MTLSYDDLVAAATVGITRKPLAMTGLGGPAAGYDSVLDAGDPAAALLDAAALLTVARRAGVQPRRGVTLPAPPADSAPALSDRAVQALRKLCWPTEYHWRWNPQPEDAEFLASLLNAAADAGYVAPGSLLADLLDAAVKNPALGPAASRMLGARGRLLVRFRQTWRDALAAADAISDPDIWRTGSPAERLAYLGNLRDRDPAAARDLLTAAWAQEHGRDRARFIPVLSRHLSPADEEFLEAALKDRAATVHAQVPQMLARLPGSAFVRRASERAASLLRLDEDRTRLRLLVSLPGKPDSVAARDGIGGEPPAPGIGESAWWLTQTLATAPLADWTTRFGLSARDIAGLPVEGGLRADVHAGWRMAAVLQGDAEWARALLDAGRDGSGRPPEAWPPDRVLAAALPPGEWAAVLLAAAGPFLSGLYSSFHGGVYSSSIAYWHPHSDALLSEVAAFPAPWPRALADAVIAAFDHQVAAVRESPPPGHRHMRRPAEVFLQAAGRRMPATGDRDYAAELARLAAISPFGQSAFESAAETINHRRSFFEEIS